VVAEAAGTYRLLVKAKYPRLPAGRYEIQLVEVRNATEQDRLLYDAWRLETTSKQLRDAGKFTEALPPGEKAVELQERVLGTADPRVAWPLINLASIHYFKGDYAKAEELYMRGLTAAEKALGPEHPLVGRLVYNLAITYISKSDPATAEAFHQRALSIQEKVLGPDHPLVGASLADLGALYRRKGDFVRSEAFLQRAVKVQERALGEEHNLFAAALGSLASLYREKGDYAKAAPLYERVVAIWGKTNHVYLPIAQNNLANIYRDMGDYDKAESLYLRAIATKVKPRRNIPMWGFFVNPWLCFTTSEETMRKQSLFSLARWRFLRRRSDQLTSE
jgi:tetratricopeptide (TPR) repeat protein